MSVHFHVYISYNLIHLQPRTYAINHATAYAGRETVKALITVLDEEALAPPCRNKAELLTDQIAPNEAEPVCLLTLYKYVLLTYTPHFFTQLKRHKVLFHSSCYHAFYPLFTSISLFFFSIRCFYAFEHLPMWKT